MKLTRKDFYEALEVRCENVVTFRKTYARHIMDELFDLLFDTMVEGFPFRIKKTAKLVPYVKKGGRPVRNPKTGEEFEMPDRYVVSMSGTSNQSVRKMPHAKPVKPTSVLIKELEHRLYKVVDAHIFAKLAFETFNDVMQNLKKGDVSVEIRGLGVFSGRVIDKKIARNPKTGEKVELKEPTVRFRFKESAVLKRALEKELASVSE